MKTKVNSVVELVRGGNTFKQGDEKEIAFVIKEDGQILDLDGATATIILANEETVVLERQAEIVNDEIIIQFLNEDIDVTGYGEMLLEIKIVKDELVRRFPADGFQQIRITPTLDNLEFKGVPFVTVETFVNRMDTFDQTLTTQEETLTEQSSKIDVLQRKNEGVITPKQAPYNAKGDGTTDETSIFNTIISDIGTKKGTILISSSFRFSQNITFPENITIQFLYGGMFSVDANITVAINGGIEAGNYQIFSGSGSIDKSTSPTSYNVSWYEGVSLNKKWDKMSANFNAFIQKNIIVPKPHPNQIGAVKPNNTVNRWWWLLDAPLIINDNCSLSKIHFEGELYAPTNIGTGVVFGLSEAKPETIHLPLGLSVQASSANRLSIGIEVRSIARLIVTGIIDVNQADKALVIGGANHVGNVGIVEFDSFHCGFAKSAGIEIYGKGTFSINNIKFNQVTIENNAQAGVDALIIKGATRQIVIDSLFYLTNLGSNCKSVFVVQNTAEGTPLNTVVNSVYASMADDFAVRTEDLTGGVGQVIEALSVSNIYTSSKGVSLRATKSAFIKNVSGGSSIYIDVTCIYTQLEVTNRNRTITDNGELSVINGMGWRAYGTGATPNTAQWTIGNTVVNTTDKTAWLKYRETGVSADDFIKLN